jgi:hypothetical protein
MKKAENHKKILIKRIIMLFLLEFEELQDIIYKIGN